MSEDLDFETEESRPELPPADFDFLVYSLRLQAELNLGLLPFGASGEDAGPADFELARHNIDLLSMLQEKTRGNLTDEEKKLLDTALYETRMRYVSVASQFT